jgi:hypothetical protein
MGRNSKKNRDKKRRDAQKKQAPPLPQKLKIKPRSFTTKSTGGLLSALITDVHVTPITDLEGNEIVVPNGPAIKAIWDTGATNSTITERVATQLGLVSTGMTQVQTAGGMTLQQTFQVNLFLPNMVLIPNLKANQMGDIQGADMLIGMDVIALGDFSVTNRKGITWFSFRWPSLQHMDFIHHIPGARHRCTCGSGKRFCECCGDDLF